MHAKLRKAVFPVAGLGSRFLPVTKASPKEMLPIVDKPLIQYAVEEAAAAGITEMIFVTGRNKRAIEDHFDKAYELETELERKHKDALLEMVRPEFTDSTWQAFRRVTLENVPARDVASELGLSVNAVLIARSRVLSRLREQALRDRVRAAGGTGRRLAERRAWGRLLGTMLLRAPWQVARRTVEPHHVPSCLGQPCSPSPVTGYQRLTPADFSPRLAPPWPYSPSVPAGAQVTSGARSTTRRMR